MEDEENVMDEIFDTNPGEDDLTLKELTEEMEGIEVDLTEADDDVERLFFKGLMEHQSENYEEAIVVYKQAIGGTKLDKVLWNNIGVSYRNIGDLDKALEAFNKCLKLDNKYVLALENKGALFGDTKRVDEGIALLKKATKLDHERDNAWMRLGVLHSRKMEFDEARNAYDKALELNPENVAALNQAAILHHTIARVREEWESIGLLETAAEYLEKAIEIKPSLVETWNNYGLILGFLGKYKGSITALDEANNLSPEYAPAHYNKARIYVITGEPEKAILELKKTVALEPDLYEVAKNDISLRKIVATEDMSQMIQDGLGALAKAKEYAREENKKRKKKRG